MKSVHLNRKKKIVKHVASPFFDWTFLFCKIFSLFRISDFPLIFCTSSYLEVQLFLPKIMNFLLCLIILPIWKGKSSQMFHMFEICSCGRGRMKIVHVNMVN